MKVMRSSFSERIDLRQSHRAEEEDHVGIRKRVPHTAQVSPGWRVSYKIGKEQPVG